MDKRCHSLDTRWYKGTCEWRIAFDFRINNQFPSWGVISPDWRLLQSHFDSQNWKFRKRNDILQAIFTSDHNLLDYILSATELHNNIVEVQYTSNIYQETLDQLGVHVATDIKFVKNPTEWCYQVTLGPFDYRLGDHDVRVSLGNYLATHFETAFEAKGYYREILVRIRDEIKGKKPLISDYRPKIFDGFSFFAKDVDDIMTLIYMAPNKIKKVVKLIEKKGIPNEG